MKLIIFYTTLQIIPALRKYVAEKGEAGNVPVVISTCFPREDICTHYAVRYYIGDECVVMNSSVFKCSTSETNAPQLANTVTAAVG